MSETKTITVPWHDGTEREIPEGSYVLMQEGTQNVIRVAKDGGWHHDRTSISYSLVTYPWGNKKVLCVLETNEEFPIKEEDKYPIGTAAVWIGFNGEAIRSAVRVSETEWIGAVTYSNRTMVAYLEDRFNPWEVIYTPPKDK